MICKTSEYCFALFRSNEKEIRKRVRDTLEVCLQDTGYCFGTGNSVANYIPVENYLIMMDEAFRIGVQI